MIRFILILCLFIFTYLKVAHLASFLPNQDAITQSYVGGSQTTLNHTTTPASFAPSIATTTAAQFNLTTSIEPQVTSTLPTPPIETTVITTTQDPNADPDDLIQPSTPINEQPDIESATVPPSKGFTTDPPGKTANKNQTQQDNQNKAQYRETSIEVIVLFASIFFVYISFAKLIYHSLGLIKYNLTEPGILMIFGILWELILRQITSNYNSFPKFNSRVFFYLFLPSTVLESASLLSNKWLYINLFPILLHSIIGTLCYASAFAFTIYSLTRYSIFNFNTQDLQQSTLPIFNVNSLQSIPMSVEISNLLRSPKQANWISDLKLDDKGFLSGQPQGLELANLTLADCLVFGTILSSVDSSTLLGVFRILHVNEKLYYMILGENLMNNAVVLVIFNLLLEFFNATRLTVAKVYFAIIQFFITLIGSIFIGLTLACLALISIRLTKKVNMPRLSGSYQYQAMVETLLILKLAYLSYTVASIAGTSSILSLATFGILHDQYIKHNLNLRSQLTFKQIIMATKTMGSSLVYPLLGMSLVDVASSSQLFQSSSSTHPFNAVASQLDHSSKQYNTNWNFKFLSMITLFAIVFRFAVVLSISMISNLFTSNQLKIKFREQTLMAYGGLKGPLAFALVHKLIEHEEFRGRTMRNKHLFMYIILSITFLSTIIKGYFIRPLVSRLKVTSSYSLDGSLMKKVNSCIVFHEINCKTTDYITHGLNSIIGHRKSPYDRFVDFNEVNIKPWLARDSSNTNWLSVFYDNLILDETLNANCFYRSAEQILPMAVAMQQTHAISTNRRASSVRRLQNSFLDTIAENRMLVRRRIHNSSLNDNGRTSHAIGPSSRKLTSGGETVHRALASRGISGGERSLLKEFVMFNLKLDEARRRKQSTAGKFSKVGPRSSVDDNSLSLRAMRMLSTTSSNAQTSSSIEMNRIQRDKLVDDMEHRSKAGPLIEHQSGLVQGDERLEPLNVGQKKSTDGGDKPSIHKSPEKQLDSTTVLKREGLRVRPRRVVKHRRP